MHYLNLFGSIITLSLGFLGLLFPRRAASFTGLAAQTKEGFSEFRATFGGLFVALGLFPLISQTALAYQIVGSAWLATGLGRLVSMCFDSGFTKKNGMAFVLECGLGLLHVLGNINGS